MSTLAMSMAAVMAVALAACVWLALRAVRTALPAAAMRPVSIRQADARSPVSLARSAVARVDRAARAGATRLGKSELVHLGQGGGDAALVPSEAERAAHASHRMWYVEGDAWLPDGLAFHAEVVAGGLVLTAAHGVYSALWAGNKVLLAAHSTVMRWAHGHEVFVDAHCNLAGRVTADRRLALRTQVRFTLLHAPQVLFLPVQPGTPQPPTRLPMPVADLQGVTWDALNLRAVAHGPLVVPDGTAWHGDLLCTGDLAIGQHCVVHGSLRVRGRLNLGAGCRVSGSVTASKAVRLDDGCTVRGALVSRLQVVLGRGCVVGAPGVLVMVRAPVIEVEPGVQVHGTLWAARRGVSVVDAWEDETPVAPAHLQRVAPSAAR